MDTTKQNQATGGQDSSDDLIAELARLVAKDARTTSSNSAAYQQRLEPNFNPQSEAEPEQTFQDQSDAALSPRDTQDAETVPAAEIEPEASSREDGSDMFDFGFGSQTASRSPEAGIASDGDGDDHDPIAELIANAAQDEMAADSDADSSDSGHDEDRLFATPTQETVDTAGLWGEPRAAQSPTARPEDQNVESRDDFSYDDDRWSPPSYADQRNDPQAHKQTDNSDPLSEIEALIGEAARVSVADDGGASGRRVKSSFLDHSQSQAPQYSSDDSVDAAEAAILAAAAANGAQVRRVQGAEADAIDDGRGGQVIPDPLFAARPASSVQPQAPEPTDQDEFSDENYALEEDFAEPVRRRRRPGFLLPAAAGAILFALIGGTYFMFFSGPVDPGEAPVLSADAGAFKEEAPETVSTDAASQSVVFNELGGNTTGQDGETLVSRDQTGGVTGDEVSSVISSEGGEMTLANRPVRTVTVRPDGTIVNAENSVAGSNILPVNRPDVPTVSNSVTASDPIGEAIALAMGEEAAAGGSSFDTASAPAPVGDIAAEAPAAETDAATVDTQETAPSPIPRPASVSSPVTDSSASSAPAVPTDDLAAVQTPAQTAQVSDADVGAWVQLSSQRSEEVARAGIPTLQSQYGTLFNGATLDVSRVDLGDRGIYYRVRLPQPTFEAATSVCNAIRAQAGDCFVLNN